MNEASQPLDSTLPLNGLSLRSLLEYADIGVVIHRWDSSVVYANPTALKLLRLSHDQIIGRNAFDPQWAFVDDLGRRLQPDEYPVSQAVRSEQPLPPRVIGVRDSSRDGISWFRVKAYCERSDSPEHGFVVVVFNDLTTWSRQFDTASILDRTQDVVIVTDADRLDSIVGPRIVYVNAAFEALTGYTAAEVIGKTPRLLQGHGTSPEGRARIREALLRGDSVTETLLNYSKAGRPYWLEMSIFPLKNRRGELTHFAAIERDVTERIHREQQLAQSNSELRLLQERLESEVEQRTKELREVNRQLEELAFTDPLTGLPNRRCLLSMARQAFERARRHGHVLLFGIVDVDHFKRVNDQHGHDVGDRVLCRLADALRAFFRAEDTCGRLGGEEFGFAVVLEGTHDPSALAERLRLSLARLGVAAEDLPESTVSIGLAQVAPGSCTMEEAMRRADRALYRAKRTGRNRVCLYESTDDVMPPASGA